MKKMKLFLAPLLVIPFLASCGGGGNPEEDLKFTVVNPVVSYEPDQHKATVQLDWTPTSHSLSFKEEDFVFTYGEGETSDSCTISGGSTDRPLTVDIYTCNELKNNVTGVLSFIYNDATTKKSGSGSVSDITIDVGEEPTPGELSKDEFNDAVTFNGVEYLQVSDPNPDPGNPYTKQYSPTVYHSITSVSPSNSYDEVYVGKEDDAYTVYERYDSTSEQWAVSSGTAEDFKLPQAEDLLTIQGAVFEYDDFTYEDGGVYVTTTTLQSITELTYKISFNGYKKVTKAEYVVTMFDQPFDAGEHDFTYMPLTPDLPDVPEPTDPYVVNEAEFTNALKFNNISYLQIDDSTTGGFPQEDYELSPTVCHTTNYNGDIFVSKKMQPTIKYNQYFHDSSVGKGDGYIYTEDVSGSFFFTPNDYEVQAINKLPLNCQELKNYNYDENTHTYIDNVDDGDTVTLQFKDKKILSINIASDPENNDIIYSYSYAYENTTPVIPTTIQDTSKITLPTTGEEDTVSVNVEHGKIYVEIENASILTNASLIASCHLPNESSTSIYQRCAYNEVLGYYENGVTPFSGYSVDVDNRKQLWTYDFQGTNTDTFYAIITLNEDFSSTESGTIKKDFTGTVDCSLKKEVVNAKTEYFIGFEISSFVGGQQ